MSTEIVSYLRVSTARQGQSGLGLEAQRQAVAAYAAAQGSAVVREFVEVESGKHSDRAELQKALQFCRLCRATLVIAKLDRLSRDAHFLLGLEKAGVDFVCADMPSANRLTIGIMAVVAEEERRMISARTRAALQAAKARGVVLGGYRGGYVSESARQAAKAATQAAADARACDVMGAVRELQAGGARSLRELAAGLRERGIRTPRGSSAWTPTGVARVLARAGGRAGAAL